MPSRPAVILQCTRDTSAASTTKSARAARPIVLLAPNVRRKVIGVLPFDLRSVHMRRYFRVLVNQFATAAGSAGAIWVAVSLAYSSTSPVVAGRKRWLTPGIFTTSTGAGRLRSR